MTRRLTPLLAAASLALGTSGCAGPASGPPDDTGGAAIDTVLQVGGTGLFVHAEGAGEPIVVVHGGPLLDHGHLVEPLRPLADRFRLVFYDQRLSGRSEGRVDSASVTLDRFVEDIEGIRLALGLDRLHLMGHSWGGLIAMKYAIAHPDQLRSLVLVSPLPPSSTLWQDEQRAQAADLQPEDTAGMGALRASPGMEAGAPTVIERLLQLSFRAQLHDPVLADSLRFHIPTDYRDRSRQFSLLAGDLQSFDLFPDLAGLGAPTLVVYGASETGAAPTADALRATIPDVWVAVIPEAGHFAYFEKPSAFRTVLTSFLEELR